ncbi:MAG: hypothetical protein NT069_31635 [Planctomycetota bacterium]|nr:hypothetical protein [Planctomycetota bacterium]
MREIIGDRDEPEFGAAQQLDSLIVQEWGKLEEPRQKITIITAAQCHGQKIRDIDLLLLVQLHQPLPVPIPQAGRLGLPSEVHVKSLCMTIEVKDHPPDAVTFTENGEVRVRYPDHWHNASKQSRKQVFSLKHYLEILQHEYVPFITGLVWLRGVPQDDLPDAPHNIVGADASWCHFVAAALSQQEVEFRDGFHILNSGRVVGRITRIRNIFAQPFRPSALDRRKLEAIARQSISPYLEVSTSGERQVVYRGRGGTGKTVALLHMAYDRYVRARERTLFLTYNIALAAEIERLLTILGVRDQTAGRSIRVETIQTFLGQVLNATGLLDECDEFLNVYDVRKRSLLEYLKDPDLLRAVREESDLLRWDLVCVDEAQDCPEDERDILHLLFGPERCAIADGIDQMVRPSDPCDWNPTPMIRNRTHTRFLKKSLRMQHNICTFANAAAQAMGLDTWQIEPNKDLLGGRVVITTQPVFPEDRLYERMAAINQESGNDPVDMLFCVPYTLVDRPAEPHSCRPAREFVKKGRKVWDGTRPLGRVVPIHENSVHRFVQYDSCRGLEGWITFLFSLDRFYDIKLHQFQEAHSDKQPSPHQNLAAQLAAEWLMIPLTRCINTSVIHLENGESGVGKRLLEVAAQFADFVEVI